jgi:hypothetical protein
MNSDQFLSLVRTILQIAGTVVVSHGVLGIDGASWEIISGAIIVVAPTIWGIMTRTDAAKIASVAAMPDVTKIIVKATATDGVANAAADPSQPKVVTATKGTK